MTQIPGTAVRLNYYAEKWKNCTVQPWAAEESSLICLHLNDHKPLFEKIAAPFNIPWYVPAILSQMESDLDLSTHLANGDPLTSDTKHVPANIMAKYRPDLRAPFTFVDAAQAALQDYKCPDGWGRLS